MILKQNPQDFIVEEIPGQEWHDEGKYCIYLVKKRGMNTQDAASIISKRFRINIRDIKYAGTKDKQAVTSQYMSIPSYYKVSDFIEENLSVIRAGYSNTPLSLGALEGNRFVITLREMTLDESRMLRERDENLVIPNYFDEQRFSKNNLEIGLNMLKGDFKRACELLLESSGSYEDDARLHLAAFPNDYVSALLKVPKKTLLMFVHAVQSYIFNEALCRMLIDNAQRSGLEYGVVNAGSLRLVFYKDISGYDKISPDSICIAGFGSMLDHYSKGIFEELGITQRSFIVRQIPEISVEGTSRQAFVHTRIKSEILDEMVILNFELPKGSYATIVVKGLLA